LASAGGDGVKLWNVGTGSLLRAVDSGGELILALAFSPDGRQLAGGGTGRTVKLWDVQTGTLTRTSTGSGDFVRSLAFSADGSTVVVADRTLTRTWNLGTGRMRPIISGTSFAVVALSSDGRVLGAAVRDDAIKALPLQ
jgi:WD40 repeat protein